VADLAIADQAAIAVSDGIAFLISRSRRPRPWRVMAPISTALPDTLMPVSSLTLSEVDEVRRRGQAQLHRLHQALSAGEVAALGLLPASASASLLLVACGTECVHRFFS
jgi:hypothetical protein